MMTGPEERAYRLGKVRALLEAAESALREANKAMPSAALVGTDEERLNIRELHADMVNSAAHVRQSIETLDRFK